MARVSGNEYIVVNGERMTIKEWKSMVAEKQKTRRGKKRFLDLSKPKKEKKEENGINVIAEEIEKLIKAMTVLKSVQVYKNHAYRSWGTIANEILMHKGISRPMSSYCVRFGEFNKLIEDIQGMSKNNEKDIFQYLDKAAWKLDDMKNDILSMINGVEESGVCERFKGHEAIYGEGRQLGLSTVVKKCLNGISDIEHIISTLKKYADEGVDPFSYGEHMSLKARARCWA